VSADWDKLYGAREAATRAAMQAKLVPESLDKAGLRCRRTLAQLRTSGNSWIPHVGDWALMAKPTIAKLLKNLVKSGFYVQAFPTASFAAISPAMRAPLTMDCNFA